MKIVIHTVHLDEFLSKLFDHCITEHLMLTTISYSKDYASLKSAGTKYSLTAVNDSAQPWKFYVYQTTPNQPNNMFSLAWFASPYQIRVGDQIRFEWEINYNFVWSDTGSLIPGVRFNAFGTKDADPEEKNSTNFSGGIAPGFSSPEKEPPPGSLIINDGDDVPNKKFSVGIGMSGAGTFAVQAGTNLKHQFTPTPRYWIAAGIDEQCGTVLNIQTITQAQEIAYDPATYEKTATLTKDNTWTVA